MHDKRLPCQTVFPKDGMARKTVRPNRRGQESLRNMMPPRIRLAHGGVAFSARRAGIFFAAARVSGGVRHAGGTLGA